MLVALPLLAATVAVAGAAESVRFAALFAHAAHATAATTIIAVRIEHLG
jgi:hypothetical protein